MSRRVSLVVAAVAFTVALLACSFGSTSPTPTTAAPALSPTPTPASASTPSSAGTSAAATIPAILTSVPGIAGTLTAVFSTPGLEGTLAAQQTMAAGTQAVLSPQLASTFLSQCPHPSDPPMQDWFGVPVMPQATAGQQVDTLVGPYYCFRAPVTVQDMEAFYKGKLAAPQWVLESDVNGTMEFIGLSQAGPQFLVLASGPGDQNDLIVAINISRPVSIPTP